MVGYIDSIKTESFRQRYGKASFLKAYEFVSRRGFEFVSRRGHGKGEKEKKSITKIDVSLKNSPGNCFSTNLDFVDFVYLFA